MPFLVSACSLSPPAVGLSFSISLFHSCLTLIGLSLPHASPNPIEQVPPRPRLTLNLLLPLPSPKHFEESPSLNKFHHPKHNQGTHLPSRFSASLFLSVLPRHWGLSKCQAKHWSMKGSISLFQTPGWEMEQIGDRMNEGPNNNKKGRGVPYKGSECIVTNFRSSLFHPQSALPRTFTLGGEKGLEQRESYVPAVLFADLRDVRAPPMK